MGKIIAVVSGKGGTGKTTFTANTALALASMGQRVLCMDCDVTLRNLDLALGLSDRALMDFSDVLAGRCTLAEAAVAHEKYPSLSLLTAPMADRPLELSVASVKQLAADLGVTKVDVVANKIRDDADREFVRSRIPEENLLGFISYDAEVIDADRRGLSPYDVSPRAVEEIRAIKARIDET